MGFRASAGTPRSNGTNRSMVRKELHTGTSRVRVRGEFHLYPYQFTVQWANRHGTEVASN